MKFHGEHGKLWPRRMGQSERTVVGKWKRMVTEIRWTRMIKKIMWTRMVPIMWTRRIMMITVVGLSSKKEMKFQEIML